MKAIPSPLSNHLKIGLHRDKGQSLKGDQQLAYKIVA